MTTTATIEVGTGYTTDISDHCYEVAINRGRNRELDDIPVGTCEVRFRNYDRAFDPTFLGSTTSYLLMESGDYLLTESNDRFILEGGTAGLFGDIRPATPVRVTSSGGVVIFTGWIEDWNYTYTPNGVYEGTFLAVDALGLLARRELAAHTGGSSQTEGTRIAAVIARSEINWTETTDIDAGLTSLQADSVAEATNCLRYCQLVAETGLGRLFAARTGAITYRDRGNLVASASTITFNDTAADWKANTAVPFTNVSVVFGAELLYTRAVVTRASGTAQTATASQAAIDEFGIRSLSKSGLLMTTDAEALNMAQFLANRYSEPIAVNDSLSVALERDDINTANRNTVAGLEIGDTVTVTWTPTGTGDVSTQTLTIEGVNHHLRFDVAHIVTLHLSNPGDKFGFVLDSNTLGVLSTSRLGY